MLGSAEQDSFITRSMIAIVTTIRRDGSPSSSMVAYSRRDDALFFTTTLDRAKGKMLVRDPRACLTVLNPAEPWSFVTIDGHVLIHRDNPVELRELLLGRVGDTHFPWTRDEVEPMIAGPGRAVFEVVATRVSGVILPVA